MSAMHTTTWMTTNNTYINKVPGKMNR
jgi:hypothetical protein